MNDHVYTVTEIVGTAKTLRTLEWFEVTQIKGHIVDGGVGHYQVCMRLGFRYESPVRR